MGKFLAPPLGATVLNLLSILEIAENLHEYMRSFYEITFVRQSSFRQTNGFVIKKTCILPVVT